MRIASVLPNPEGDDQGKESAMLTIFCVTLVIILPGNWLKPQQLGPYPAPAPPSKDLGLGLGTWTWGHGLGVSVQGHSVCFRSDIYSASVLGNLFIRFFHSVFLKV